MISKILSNNEIEYINNSNQTIAEMARFLNVSARTVKRVIDGEITAGYDEPAPVDYSDHYGKLVRSNQYRADVTNNLRKQIRESSRAENVIIEMTKELTNVIEANAFSIRSSVKYHNTPEGDIVGVIQLSDLHVGERVKGINGNSYDLHILAARLKKFADRAKKYFKGIGVTTVLVAATGDLINSDRRIDEITTNANNRTKIAFCAVDIIQQFLLDLNECFNVTFASVCGNESRVSPELGWTEKAASDNYDATIHFTLEYIFKNVKGISIIPMNNPLEQVINVNGVNFLLIHGHNKTAVTSKAEVEVAKIKSKYSSVGIRIDYVIFGHIHATYISDYFARSASTVGGNSYSDNALNLSSKASQNVYAVYSDGSIDGVKIDLQQYDAGNSYNVNKDVEEYKPVKTKNTVTIQSVLI